MHNFALRRKHAGAGRALLSATLFDQPPDRDLRYARLHGSYD